MDERTTPWNKNYYYDLTDVFLFKKSPKVSGWISPKEFVDIRFLGSMANSKSMTHDGYFVMREGFKFIIQRQNNDWKTFKIFVNCCYRMSFYSDVLVIEPNPKYIHASNIWLPNYLQAEFHQIKKIDLITVNGLEKIL